MKQDIELILQEADWGAYERFKTFCCVDTQPVVVSRAWTCGIREIEGDGWISMDAGFIGFVYPYRNNGARLKALPLLTGMSKRRSCYWMAQNMRNLSRVMVRPEFRGMGIATEMVKRTVKLLAVRYVECWTFAEKIESILERAGFQRHGNSVDGECGYWLKINDEFPVLGGV